MMLAHPAVTSTTRRADSFVFRLTSLCDKKCMLCCNNYDEVKQYTVAGFKELLARFAEIRDYSSAPKGHKCHPNIFLTGGEAFLYKSVSRDGIATLYEVIEAINRMMPQAKIIVKTGGFRRARKYQCALFDRIVHEYPFPIVEFRLGFNLYQDPERSAIDRFVFTIERVLGHQHFICIDTIYDKTNLRDTCRTLAEGLCRLSINIEQDMLLDLILEDPNQHRRIETVRAGETIILDLGPSYPPNKAAAAHEYYTEPSSACDTIDLGTSCLYYDTNMGLIHCNDSFVDARIPSLTLDNRSIANDSCSSMTGSID